MSPISMSRLPPGSLQNAELVADLGEGLDHVVKMLFLVGGHEERPQELLALGHGRRDDRIDETLPGAGGG